MKRLGTVRRRVGAALAMGSALTVVLTIGVHPTFASWVSTAKLGDSIGVASSSCTTPGVYRTTASSRVLAGSVAGIPLTSSSALAPLTAVNDASTVTFPAGATAQGGDGATSTVSNAAAANAVQAAGGMAALSAPSGSQTQYAAATSTGRSVAGAGAVDTAGNSAGTLPAVGDVDVSSVLAAVPGGTAARGSLSRLGLSIGTAASTATLNECARRWGASLSSALNRSTALSGLSLTTKDAALSDLVRTSTTQRAAVKQLLTTISTGTGTTDAEPMIAAVAKSGLVGAVSSTLAGLHAGGTVGAATASVVVTSDFTGVDDEAGKSASSGAVRFDGSSELLSADLRAPLPTNPAPNTAVLSAADVTAITTGASSAAGTLVDRVGTAWDSAASAVRIRVVVEVPVTLAGATILTVGQTMDGSVADFLSPTKTWGPPDVDVLGLLSLLGINLSSLLAALAPQLTSQLLGPVTSKVGDVVATPVTGAVGSAKAALTDSLAATRSALPTQLAALSSLFSITLNEQPDVAPYPPAAQGTGGGFVVTALRVRVKVAGADALDLAIASSSVGPDHTINE